MTKDGREQENLYDGEGLRAGIKENGKVTSFLYYNGEILAECDGDSAPVRRHLAGQGLSHVEDISTGLTHTYHQDEQGSTAYITGSNGTVENCYLYDAFGNIRESHEDIKNRILYIGQQYDQETGQYYLRARYYNPVIGRFTQEDTYRGDGLNLYAYCANNPVMYYDPSGHTNECNGGNTEQKEPPETLAEGVDNRADFYVTPDGDAIPEGTCLAIGLEGEDPKLRTAEQLQADADRIHSAIVTSSGQPDMKAQANRTTTVTQGYDSEGNVVHTVTTSTGVVTSSQKEVARSIYGDDVKIPTKSQVPPSTNTNSHHGEQQGIRVTEGQSGRVQASSSGAGHGGAACAPCSQAQVEAGVINVTGIQETAGGKGRNFEKK